MKLNKKILIKLIEEVFEEQKRERKINCKTKSVDTEREFEKYKDGLGKDKEKPIVKIKKEVECDLVFK